MHISCWFLLLSASNASSSNPNPQKSFWRDIWKLRVPSKVKHFVWRASDNALLTMDNLLRRKVVLSATCNICRIHVEDTTHAIWGCEGVKEAWQSLSWANLTNTSPSLDFTDLISKFLQVHDDYRVEIFVLIAWLLWNRRNLLCLSKPVHPLQMLPSLIGGMLQDFINAQEPVPRPIATTSTSHWCPLDQHCYKANYDDAIFKSSNTAGLGVVIRDSRGDILGAMSVRVLLPHFVPEVKALACCHAISFAVDLGLQEIIFEGDLAIINQAINSGLLSPALYRHIVDNILHLTLQLWFHKFC